MAEKAESKPAPEPEKPAAAPAAAAPEAAPAPASAEPAPDAAEAALAAAEAKPEAAAAAVVAPPGDTKPEDAAEAAKIEELLKQASFEDPSSPNAALPAADAEPFNLPSFQQVVQDAQVSSIDLLRDVELNVKIELGRSRMLVEDVLKLAEGSVVELDKLAGDPVDVFVNERLVARGEVLVLNDNFCVRVNEIVASTKEEAI
jgi:flagellar motor switch protein FliN